jgi:hypothetical protein
VAGREASGEHFSGRALKLGSYVALCIFGIGAVGLTHAVYDSSGSEHAPAHKAPMQEIPPDSSVDTGTNVTIPMGVAIVALGSWFVFDRRRAVRRDGDQTYTKTTRLVPAGEHDEIYFDPDSDLDFIEIVDGPWQGFSPDTGKFGK